MSKELEFDGFWEGNACYTCDCCHKTIKFRFDCEEDAKDSRTHRKILREKEGWIFTKVNDFFCDFHNEDCRNKYIRANTL